MLRRMLALANLIGGSRSAEKEKDRAASWQPAPARTFITEYKPTRQGPLRPLKPEKRSPGAGKHGRSTWASDRGGAFLKRVARRRVRNAMAKASRRRNRV